MDPNETLARIRVLCTADGAWLDPEASELSELVEVLDEWLTRGGFLPSAWAAAIPTDADAIEVTGGKAESDACPECGLTSGHLLSCSIEYRADELDESAWGQDHKF